MCPGLNEQRSNYRLDCDPLVCPNYFGPRCRAWNAILIGHSNVYDKCVCIPVSL